jgi:short-subunit dehydrogenase
MSADPKTILIVGANGALGQLIAAKLTAAGYSVIGTARTNESAANLPTGLKQGLLLDLESQDSINTLTNYVAQSPLDGIVIASGMVGFGSIQDTSAANASRLMQINHLGPAAVISALLPTLANSTNEPFVASISGVVAEKVFPGMSAYVASKTAHSTWLRAFALEARRVKVRVLDARPGHTETGLANRALFGTAPAFATGFAPESVAETIVRGIIDGLTELPSEAFTQ